MSTKSIRGGETKPDRKPCCDDPSQADNVIISHDTLQDRAAGNKSADDEQSGQSPHRYSYGEEETTATVEHMVMTGHVHVLWRQTMVL
jgi:hypothetical protein